MCHKEPRGAKTSLRTVFEARITKTEVGGKTIKIYEAHFCNSSFEILDKKRGFLREKNYLKANSKTFEGMSKFLHSSSFFPKDNSL